MSPTTGRKHLTYSAAGVDAAAKSAGLRALLGWVDKTRDFRRGVGEPLLDIGYFANVIDIGGGMALAITTDTTGSKVLIAQMVDRYDTIGIDCVAINVNDILCVGAEPLALVDCISLEEPDERILDELGKGLYLGAKQANISIVGGEMAQVPGMVTGLKPGLGLDVAGTCVGLVARDEIVLGQSIEDGDALIGLKSSGIHCNGLTLAREALFGGGYSADQPVEGLERPLGEELLEPTRIYAAEVRALRAAGVRVRALAHISGDGLLNLTRVKSEVGYVVERFPKPHAIFGLIQRAGNVEDEEMFRVYNMGIGFCAVVDAADAGKAIEAAAGCGTEAYHLGYAVRDARRRVDIRPYGLLGENGRFRKEPR
jgi:phosphoribosylformylglycinamidine cyclo-ligase